MIHVLCEKPFAINSAEAERVLNVGKAKGVLITMASKFRYVDDVVRAKQIVDSGILGEHRPVRERVHEQGWT